MNSLLSLFTFLTLASLGYVAGSIKIVNEGNKALVERLGKYRRELDPGLNFIIPVVDRIVVEDTNRERVLGIDPQYAITQDNVSLKADAVIYWQIIDLRKSFYAVENIEEALENLVLTALRSAIGLMKLEETYSSRYNINQTLLEHLDESTKSWGVKVTRVEVREIAPAKTVMESLELERAAESKKRADISATEGTVKSIEMLAQALQNQNKSQAVLQFLLAQRYVGANEELSKSNNSKVVFMDPNALNQALTDLMGNPSDFPPGKDSNS